MKPLSGCMTGEDLDHMYTGHTIITGHSEFLSPAVETTCVGVDAEMTPILQLSGVKPSHCQYHVSHVCCLFCQRPVLCETVIALHKNLH